MNSLCHYPVRIVSLEQELCDTVYKMLVRISLILIIMIQTCILYCRFENNAFVEL